MSGNDIRIRKSAPLLGEDNNYVLSEVLGLPESQIYDLENSNAIGRTLQGSSVPPAVPLDRQVELGWTVAYDPNFRNLRSARRRSGLNQD